VRPSASEPEEPERDRDRERDRKTEETAMADTDIETDTDTDADVDASREPTGESNVDVDVDVDGDGGGDADVDVDYLHDAAEELLVDLVSIPSPSGEEREAAERLAAFFRSHGRDVWLDGVGNVHAPADDAVLLTSHVDTVPGDIPVGIRPAEAGSPGDASTGDGGDGDGDGSPTGVDERPALWGRGSVDATGSLAAMAATAVETGVSFLGVVGEEVDSRGALHVLESGRREPGAVVNGEPSGWNGITLGYRGLLAGTYVATSESGHTSRPENNAIQDAMDWWNRVEAEFDPDEWTPVFERVTCKPVDVRGGLTDDGLSMETTMDVQFRVPPDLTVDEVRERADGELNGGTVSWYDRVPPVMSSPRTNLARAFRVAIRDAGGEPRLLRKTGTADMNLFAREWDCPVVSYGPGDSDLDHAPNEHLPLDEFHRSVDVLVDVCEELRDAVDEGQGGASA
jgi:LysW-gamma-L-lysine carboxypeptidase